MKSVYKIPQKIKGLSDERKRKPIPLFNIVMPVLIFLMLQYESFHTIFSAPESMEKRPKNCIRGKIPKVDAVRKRRRIRQGCRSISAWQNRAGRRL